MVRVRRLWLAPAFLLAVLIYYLFFRSPSDNLYPFQQKYPANADDGKLHWTKHKERYPVRGPWIKVRLGAPPPIPRIQYDFEVHPEAYEDRKKRLDRQAAVKQEFVHAWEGYKKHAWAKDEVSPVTGGWRTSLGGWGATMVDAMDTLWIMDMKEDFQECVKAVAEIDFTTNEEEVLNVFETTIRYIGGLLAAYDLTNRKQKVLLAKAKELGEVLYGAFDTPNRMPATRWNWRKSAVGGEIELSTSTLLAELGSLSLEFTRLTQLSGNPRYYDAVARIANEMEEMQFNTSISGLWPTVINTKELTASYNHFTFGGMADSTYEYLPKQYMLTVGRISQPGLMYDRAITSAKRYMFFRPMTRTGKDVLVSGTLAVQDGVPVLNPEGQHLTCFLGGVIALGAKLFNEPGDLDVARRLVDGCVEAYDAMPSGLMPETFHLIPCHIGVGRADIGECAWNETRWYEAIADRHRGDSDTKGMNAVERGKFFADKLGLQPGFSSYGDVRYILRPEAIESLFVLYRITGDPELQDHAWRMFQNIVKATRTDIAHAAVTDVRLPEPPKQDRMESFWLAETLKYFYLIFSDPTLINLDKWIL